MNLLDPIWLIIPFCAGAILAWIGFEQTKKIRPRDKRWLLRLIIDCLIAVTVLVLLVSLINHLIRQTVAPFTIYLWFLPFVLTITLLFHRTGAASGRRINWKTWRPIMIVLAALIFLVAGVLSLNNYFSYCSTLACHEPLEVVRKTDTKQAKQLPFEAVYRKLKDESASGEFKEVTIPSSSSNFNPRFDYVYIPPAAARNVNLQLPVVVLVGGHPSSANAWQNIDLVNSLDTFQKAHHGLAPFVFVVDQNGAIDNDTECLNSKLGNAATYIDQDVPKYIKQHYSVSYNPSDWVIAGYSAGGTCAEISALTHPYIYGNFINMSGFVNVEATPPSNTLSVLFNNSKKRENALNTDLLIKNPATPRSMNFAYVVGSQDSPSIIDPIEQQVILTRYEHYETLFWLTAGGHSFTVWKQALPRTLGWMMHQIGFTR